MKENQNRVTEKKKKIQGNFPELRIEPRYWNWKKCHAQGKIDIEAMLPRFISVKHLNFKIK